MRWVEESQLASTDGLSANSEGRPQLEFVATPTAEVTDLKKTAPFLDKSPILSNNTTDVTEENSGPGDCF